MPKLSSALLVGLLLSAGLMTSTVYALDLGKMLEDAAKQKVEEAVKGQDEPSQKPAETTAAPTSTTTPAANTGAASSDTTTPIAKTEPEKSTINWKNPSKDEEIALGASIQSLSKEVTEQRDVAQDRDLREALGV